MLSKETFYFNNLYLISTNHYFVFHKCLISNANYFSLVFEHSGTLKT